jgi:hypothetical protein
MSKSMKEIIAKSAKQLAKFGDSRDEPLVAELERALATTVSLSEARKAIKASLKENGEVLAASAKDLARAARKAKRVAEAAEKAEKAMKLVEKAKKERAAVSGGKAAKKAAASGARKAASAAKPAVKAPDADKPKSEPAPQAADRRHPSTSTEA